MILNQYHLGSLSLSSYLIGDPGSGQAVVVDPGHDIAHYLADACRHRLRIAGIINTEVHEDRISGAAELAAATGAWLGLGSRVTAGRGFRPLCHGQKIPLGSVELEIHETPGHSWESITVLVRAHAADRVPRAALTGRTLFIGEVGRPDPAAGADPVELARALYRSVHEDLMRLDDAVELLPAHAAWSALGLAPGIRHTIGEQRRTNPALQPMSEDDFVHLVAGDLHPDRHGAGARLLDTAALKTALATGARILDARRPGLFAGAHIAGSVNAGLDCHFEEAVAALFGTRERIVIVADAGLEDRARLRLAMAGFTNVRGAVRNLAGVFAALPRALATAARLPAGQLGSALADSGTVVLDVRSTAEREGRFMPATLHVPLAELTRRHSQLPVGRRIVVCGGWRASTAASALRALGHSDVADVAEDPPHPGSGRRLSTPLAGP